MEETKKGLVIPKINRRDNLEIILRMPLFSFKIFLRKNKDLTFNELWQKLIEDTDLIWIEPEDIGALTDAPILGYQGNIYWFSDYEIVNEFEVLLKNSRVEFQLAFEKNRIDFQEYAHN